MEAVARRRSDTLAEFHGSLFPLETAGRSVSGRPAPCDCVDESSGEFATDFEAITGRKAGAVEHTVGRWICDPPCRQLRARRNKGRGRSFARLLPAGESRVFRPAFDPE